MSRSRFYQREQDVANQQNAGKDIINYNLSQDSIKDRLIFDLWKEQTGFANELLRQRNRYFVFLVLAAGGGLLLLLRIPIADALLVDAIAKFLSITDPTIIKTGSEFDFPFDALLSGILVLVAYLMQKLYLANLSVVRLIGHLGTVETRMRESLNLRDEAFSFTSEGGSTRADYLRVTSKFFDFWVLFISLIPFIVLKFINDFQVPNFILLFVDLVVSLVVILFWWEYGRSSFQLDVQKIEAPKDESTAPTPEPATKAKSSRKTKHT